MRNNILLRRRSSVVLSDIAEEQFDASRRRSSVLASDIGALRFGDPARRRSSVMGFNVNRITNNASKTISEDQEMSEFQEIIKNHSLPNGDIGKLRRMSLEIESMVADDSLKRFLVTAIFITLFLVSVIAFSIYQRIGI